MGDTLGYIIALAGVAATISTVITGLVSQYFQSRSMSRQMKRDDRKQENDAAAQMTGLSLQQITLFSQILQECQGERRQLEDENQRLRLEYSLLIQKIRLAVEELRSLMINHEIQSDRLPVPCPSFNIIQGKIETIVKRLVEKLDISSNEDTNTK